MVRKTVPGLRPPRELSGPEATVMMAVALGHVQHINDQRRGVSMFRWVIAGKDVTRTVHRLTDARRLRYVLVRSRTLGGQIFREGRLEIVEHSSAE